MKKLFCNFDPCKQINLKGHYPIKKIMAKSFMV